MEKYKIIIDTNLWISLLIGKRLSELQSLCNSPFIKVFICDELKEEFIRVSNQEKIKKYASNERIVQTLKLIETSCIMVSIGKRVVLSKLRDVNDLYLLALAETVNADFILTGDKDLLTLKNHRSTKIVYYQEFIALVGFY